MKKFLLFILTVTLLQLFSACTYTDPVIASLPEYQSEVFYTSGGFQDSTDYAKYIYGSVTTQQLVFSEYFCKVNADDVEEILLHIQNFEEWIKVVGGELQENYDFDHAILSVGDYFYLRTKAGEAIGDGVYDYTIYYFDVDTLTLYYFHNNI